MVFQCTIRHGGVCVWNGKWSVLCSWESWAGGCWGSAWSVQDGVFLVGSGQEQSRTQVLHSPGLGKRAVSQWQGEGGKGWGLQLHPAPV